MTAGSGIRPLNASTPPRITAISPGNTKPRKAEASSAGTRKTIARATQPSSDKIQSAILANVRSSSNFLLSVAPASARSWWRSYVPWLPADQWMELPPVMEPVMADHAPCGDLLADMGRNEWELGLDLEHEEGTLAFDPDVIVAVEFVADLTHVADDRRVCPAALPGGDRLDRDRLVLPWRHGRRVRLQHPFGPERSRSPAVVLDRPDPVAGAEDDERHGDRDPSPVPVGKGVFELGLRFSGARISRPDRPGNGPPRRQEDEEAARPDGQTNHAVARVLDAGPDATDREHEAEAQGEPAERSARHHERGHHRSGHRQVVAEQARIDRLGEQRADIQHEERARPVIQVPEREVEQQRADRGDETEQQFGPPDRGVRSRSGPGDHNEHADQRERHDRKRSADVGTECIGGEPAVQGFDQMRVHGTIVRRQMDS